MFKPLSKLLILIIMLLTFVGQAMASHYVLSLENSEHGERQLDVQSVILDKQKQANHSIEDEEDCCEVECCEGECICPANTCASLVFLAMTTSSKFTQQTGLLFRQTIKNPTAFPTSHYKPPIYLV